MEFDPLLKSFKPLRQPRIILGSFPTWTLTTPDITKGETEELKLKQRKENGDFPFFYGSSRNLFWSWYKEHAAIEIDVKNVGSIRKALKANNIGLTNIISSAKRKGVSSFDYDLTNRMYNYSFLAKPKGDIKILCTSKAVLNEMLLKKGFFAANKHLELVYDKDKESAFQEEFINRIGGAGPIKKPIYRCLVLKKGYRIKCLAIPSPGSPFRGLAYFGHKKGTPTKAFLKSYLREAFGWFLD